jgi:hypothetical protein
MKFRKLRIAWSVGWGLLAVLLIVLWVRGYWYWDHLYNPISSKSLVIIESASSRIILKLAIPAPGSPWRWHLSRELRGNYWEGSSAGWHEQNRDKGFIGFAYYASPWETIYRVPHWFLVLLPATLGVAPWLRWSKRFSLRTLLIATTLVAVVLGLAVWAAS